MSRCLDLLDFFSHSSDQAQMTLLAMTELSKHYWSIQYIDTILKKRQIDRQLETLFTTDKMNN